MNSDYTNEEVVREIVGRRVHVLQKFSDFEQKASEKRRFLVQSGQLQRFLRITGDVHHAVESLIETAEDVNIRHSADHLARTQKVLNRLRGEADGRRNDVAKLGREAAHLVDDGHYAIEEIQKTLADVRSRWEYLLKLLDSKWLEVQKEIDSIEFSKKCVILLNWISKTTMSEKPGKEIFDEIRNYSGLWTEIVAIHQQIEDPSPTDTENYQTVRSAWHEFQQYVNSVHRELNEHERLQKFVDNVEHLTRWMVTKEDEIRDKYSHLSVEDAMKYRKTIEIEIKSTDQRIQDLKEQVNNPENADQYKFQQQLKSQIEKVEDRFTLFQKFVEDWRQDLKTAADRDALLKEADDIRFWCSEKVEDLQTMKQAESVDCEELAMWIETNTFDFNSWDTVFNDFADSAQKYLENTSDDSVGTEIEKVTTLYGVAKETCRKCNDFLETRIATINIEKLIYQTHQKAAHLVSVLQKSEQVFSEKINVEDAEKELLMMDGVAVRCVSVVEQIEQIQAQMDQKYDQLAPLSKNASDQLEDLAEMKKILEASSAKQKIQLQRIVDIGYFVDSCCEIKNHAEAILVNLKDGKAKRESIQPIKEQLESLNSEMSGLNMNEKDMQVALNELRNCEITLEVIQREQDVLAEQFEARKVTERTEKFAQRVLVWIENSERDDEIDSSLQSPSLQTLHRVLKKCEHLFSSTVAYLKSIEKRHAELGETVNNHDSKSILDELKNSLNSFGSFIQKKKSDTEAVLDVTERTAELNSQNDWVRSKIKWLSDEPLWDSLLSAQRMKRRFERDADEIENRRKNINAILENMSGMHSSAYEELEHNWSRMKRMVDERGGILDRMIKLYEYDEASSTVSEWLQEKLIYVEAIKPKEDDSINRAMLKKLDVLADEVSEYKPTIVEIHALLEDALVTPNAKDSNSQQVIKFKSTLTRKQGDIESDYTTLKTITERKLKEIRLLLQDNELSREIADIENWIEKEEVKLNRYLTTDAEDLSNKLDDVMSDIQRRRVKLTDMKCEAMGGGQFQIQKIDDAFGMLDVFTFELDRIKQKSHRSLLLKKLKAETADLFDVLQTTRERIETYPSVGMKCGVAAEFSNLDGDLETLRRRVISSLDKAKEIRGANADLAPQVYDLEEQLEKEWTEISKAAENWKKEMEREKLLSELETELLDMENWIDTFNEEVIVVTGGIHDVLGVAVGIESIDTWREDLSHRCDQLGNVKNVLASVLSAITQPEGRNEWLRRVDDIESDLVKARRTIDAKQDELEDFSNVLEAGRDCDRLYTWAMSKREQLEAESLVSNAKTVVRKMNEVERMMISRTGEVESIKEFVKRLHTSNKPSSFKSTELEGKLELLEDEWTRLEDELKRRETDLNESMSQLLLDEQFERIQQWIDERKQSLEFETSQQYKPAAIEKRQKHHEKLSAEINEYLPVYEDFLNNEHLDDDKRHAIRTLWNSFIEITTIRQKSLAQEVQSNRLLDLLEDIGLWLTDSETEVHSAVNFNSFYKMVDAEKASRRLKSLNEQAGEKDDLLRRVRKDDETNETVERLREGISELKQLIKANNEDLEVWKNMQEVIKAMDDEICWYKEISVIVSSTDVGHDTSSLDVIKRKHQRLLLEAERRKQKVAKIVDRTTELVSGPRRPSLDAKIDEIDDKLAQMTELLDSNNQIAEIRTNRLRKWTEYFMVIDEIREKEHVLDGMAELKNGTPDAILADVERKCEVLDTLGEQLDTLKTTSEQMSNDEFIRTKGAENAVDNLRSKWLKVSEFMGETSRNLKETIESAKFTWKCDTAIRCIQEQEEKISNIVKQKKPTGSFENAAYHSTISFVERYSDETINKLIATSRQLRDPTEANKKLLLISERLDGLRKQLELLAEKIKNGEQRKERTQNIQDEYSKRACELDSWLERAEEEVTDVVWFQTKESSIDCRNTLMGILEAVRNDKLELLEELELLEVELAELNEDVNAFTWHSYKALATRMNRLEQTIYDRVKVVDEEIRRHMENEKICEDAANTLQMCRNIILEVKKEFDHLHRLKLDDQKNKLLALIEKIHANGMVGELEEWRSLMGSRFIFNNKFTSITPHGVLVETYQVLELMSSMLRSVEQSIAERNSSGVSGKQLREFELAFEYFDQEKKGWLDYEHFELCLKSQGYDFTVENSSAETLAFLDPSNNGRIIKSIYMHWMVKNETTNILDDQSAIEEALKSLDARKISDSMSRKEAEFFMRKIAKYTETYTEHIHLEYKDFVDSFY